MSEELRRQLASEQLRAWHRDPEYRKWHRANLEKINTDPVQQVQRNRRLRLLKKDPKYQERNRKHLQRMGRDPEVQAKRLASLRSPKNRQAAAERRRAMNNSPEHRAKMGWLSEDEVATIVAECRTDRTYRSIAKDWLMSPGRVAEIARQHGIRRNRSPKSKMIN